MIPLPGWLTGLDNLLRPSSEAPGQNQANEVLCTPLLHHLAETVLALLTLFHSQATPLFVIVLSLLKKDVAELKISKTKIRAIV